MSTPVVVITRPGVVNAPYTYALAAGESFEPETVTATFDCTGAAGACLPCLSVYTENGVLLGRFKADQVAAGDTAEVTWAPFLGGAGSGAASTTGDWMLVGSADTAVGGGGVQTYISLNSTLDDTSNAAIYDMQLGSGGLSTKYGFRVLSKGVYLVSWNFQLSQATAGDHITCYYVGDIGVRSSWLLGYSDILYATTTTQYARFINFTEIMGVYPPASPVPGGPEIPWAQNLTGNAFHVQVSVYVTKLPDTNTGTFNP